MDGRRTKQYLVESEGRDKGKRFLITEMSASKAESWAYRLILALANSNTELPEGFEKTGMAGLAQIGLRGLVRLPWFVAEPLLKEMFECVQAMPDAKNLSTVRPLQAGDDGGEGDYDIQEVTTRMNLRLEIFKLHVDFSEAAIQSLFGKAKTAAAKVSSTVTASRK